MTIAHIANNELGFDVRTKLNALIDLAGGAVAPFTAGSVLFADSSGNIGQDNANFFWDTTNKALSLSGSRAMFKVASGGGDNWFMANAGNFTLAGSGGAGNIGIGEITLQSLTSGSFNFALGSFTLQDLQTGDNNVALGTQVMSLNVAGSRNVGIGRAALDEQLNSDAVAVGDNALGNYDGWGSIGIGTQAAFNMTAGTKNIFIGYQCGSATSSTVNRNVWLGGYSGFGGNLSDTIVIANGDGSIMPANFSLTTSNVWSMANYATPVGLHVYNTADHVRGIGLSDWERAIFDWRVASNVLTIGTQAGGAGVLRPVNIIGSALTFNGSPIGGGGGMAIGGAITGGTAGRVLFAGAGGILDDDSTFLWNDTLKDLAIGGAYYVNAARALYVVPNVTENNWFEGNAGNQTVSGYGNFGTGDLALQSLTSGFDNVAVGTRALQKATSADSNLALGSLAMRFTQTDPGNIAIGYKSMESIGNAGAGGGNNFNNICIGVSAFGNAELGYKNVVLGYAGLSNVSGSTIGYQNTVIGPDAGNALGAGVSGGSVNNNTLIGSSCGRNLTGGTYNTWIGGYLGASAVTDMTIMLASGDTTASFMLDCNYLTANTWSFQMRTNTESGEVHIYKMQSPYHTVTNYERIRLGWDIYGSYPNVFRLSSQAGGSGVKSRVAIDCDPKAGAPANTDIPSGTFAMIDDTSGGATWLVFNKGGTIRKVQLT